MLCLFGTINRDRNKYQYQVRVRTRTSMMFDVSFWITCFYQVLLVCAEICIQNSSSSNFSVNIVLSFPLKQAKEVSWV